MTDDAIREWAGKTFNQVLIKLDATVLETAARELLARQIKECEIAAAEAEASNWDALPADQREGMTKETTYALGHATGVLAAVQAIRAIRGKP